MAFFLLHDVNCPFPHRGDDLDFCEYLGRRSGKRGWRHPLHHAQTSHPGTDDSIRRMNDSVSTKRHIAGNDKPALTSGCTGVYSTPRPCLTPACMLAAERGRTSQVVCHQVEFSGRRQVS